MRPGATRVRDVIPAQLSAPVITGVEGSPPVEEGATVAVLVTGANFVPGATYVSVLLGGAVDKRIQARRRGRHAGRHAPGHDDPGRPHPGAARTDRPGAPAPLSSHMLRVQTPAGSRGVPFPIAGRDEIRVQAGQVVAIGAPVRLSRLDVDQRRPARRGVDRPPGDDRRAGARREIWGDVRVVAATGASGGSPAVQRRRAGPGGAGGAGAAPFNAGGGGAGGSGRADRGRPAGRRRWAPPARRAWAPAPARSGSGGAGGVGANSAPDGGRSRTGRRAGLPGAGRRRTRTSSSASASSYPPGFAPGAGGGGGGGGGGEGLLAPGRPGGGGGGGGAGGGAVRIAAGRELWTYGNVVARGGDGGRGGLGSGTTGSAPATAAAAGGGGGGAIHLAGSRAARRGCRDLGRDAAAA